MIRSRPFRTLLAGLFLLDFVVVGSGVAMGMHQSGAMHGMQMAAASMAGSAGAEGPAVPPSGSDEVPCSGMQCEMPGMPDSCPSMLLCHPGTSLPALSATLLPAFTSDVRPTPAAVRAPHARLSPPELPPPRA